MMTKAKKAYASPKVCQIQFPGHLPALAQKHPVLQQNAAKLKDYGDLRNALVHHRDPRGGWIAEPSDQALQEFERIVHAIISPQKLIPRFQSSDIRVFSPQDPLGVTRLQRVKHTLRPLNSKMTPLSLR